LPGVLPLAFARPSGTIPQIPDILVSKADGFNDSPEYNRLADFELDIAGVVLSAFARYLCRIHDHRLREQNDEQIKAAIGSAHDAIEELVSTRESGVVELITDEVYENFDCRAQVLADIRRYLRPQSLALYEQWVKKHQ
jgi:hypothetical protein